MLAIRPGYSPYSTILSAANLYAGFHRAHAAIAAGQVGAVEKKDGRTYTLGAYRRLMRTLLRSLASP